MTRSIVLILPLLALACGQSPEPAPHSHDPETFSRVASAEAEGLVAELHAVGGGLQEGYNQVRYTVKDQSGAVVQAALAHTPFMNMGGHHEHSAPFTQPDAEGEGSIVFTMASSDTGHWRVELEATLGEGAPVLFVFENLTVLATGARKDLLLGERRIIVTLNFAQAPKVGQNPFLLTVHEAMEHGFHPLSELELSFLPEMPTMGHGSSGNVQPTPGEGGAFYEGSVNLSMTGLWTLSFTLGELGEVVYEIEL